MMYAKLFRFCTSFILLGVAVVPPMHAHQSYDPSAVVVPADNNAYLPVTDAQHAAWEQVIDDCLPLDTRSALSASCMTSLGEYYRTEPVWSYEWVYAYDWREGAWLPLLYSRCSQRRDHSQADFLNPDIPLWRDVFDDHIEQRQELFLRVVNDSVCQDLASRETHGIHDEWADHCAAREMYQYATYLCACLDATQRLTLLQEIVTAPQEIVTNSNTENRFEMSFRQLDENVADEALRAAAKRHMEKRYLHASWVAAQCNQHGLVLRPGLTSPAFTLQSGQTFDAYTTTDEKLSWDELKGAKASIHIRNEIRTSTHEFIMAIAMKSGDDWAIRSGSMNIYSVGELGADLMQRYPLLTHRILGDSWHGFTWEESARHRAKAYLLLVEAAGEEFARREYDPESLVQQIQYVKAGGVLKAPLTRAELTEQYWEKKRQGDVKKEVQAFPLEEVK